MRLLILGGTWFLGRALTDLALADGWSVTTFNRGTSGPDSPGVQAIHGDRENPDDLARLAMQGPWDAVVDTRAFVPQETLTVATTLRAAVGHYVIVSSVNAYTGWPATALDEQSPRYECPPDAARTADTDLDDLVQYGTFKAGCENAVWSVFGSARTTVLRPGVILGPSEYVGRLPWWLNRAASGGEMLVPAPADRPIQPIDVRDLAAFALRCAGERIGGEFNMTAPIGHARFGDLVDTCVAATGGTARPVWVDPDWLTSQGVTQWTELPLWRTTDGVWHVDGTLAHRAGLTCRPVAQTVADTWAWMVAGGRTVREEKGEAARASGHGLAPGREDELLRTWHHRS